MKTIVKKYFSCDICGKTSQNEAKIKECQQKHRMLNDNVDLEVKFSKGSEFPCSIILTYQDGTSLDFEIYKITKNK